MAPFNIHEELRAGSLVSLLRSYPTAEFSIAAVYPHRRHLEAKVRVFIDALVRSATRLDGTVSGVNEVVGALGWREEVEELADLSPGGFDVTGLGLSDEMFELGEHLFDGIEVGAVGRQEDEVGAFGSYDGASGVAFVAAEVVQDDDIARRESRGENLLDVEEEDFAVDRAIDHPRRINPVVAQRGDESQGLPMAVGRVGL